MRFAVAADQGPDFSCSGDLEIEGRRVSMFPFPEKFSENVLMWHVFGYLHSDSFMRTCSIGNCLSVEILDISLENKKEESTYRKRTIIFTVSFHTHIHFSFSQRVTRIPRIHCIISFFCVWDIYACFLHMFYPSFSLYHFLSFYEISSYR